MAIRYLVCPQCGCMRFQLKNDIGGSVVVRVTWEFEIIPVNPGESLQGFDQDSLYCLGCSLNGSVKKLKRFL